MPAPAGDWWIGDGAALPGRRCPSEEVRRRNGSATRAAALRDGGEAAVRVTHRHTYTDLSCLLQHQMHKV